MITRLKILKRSIIIASTQNVLNFLLRDEDNIDNIRNLLKKARLNGKIVRTALHEKSPIL